MIDQGAALIYLLYLLCNGCLVTGQGEIMPAEAGGVKMPVTTYGTVRYRWIMRWMDDGGRGRGRGRGAGMCIYVCDDELGAAQKCAETGGVGGCMYRHHKKATK